MPAGIIRTCKVDLWKLHSITRHGYDVVGASEIEGIENAPIEIQVTVVRCIDQDLKGGLELVLISEHVVIHSFLNIVETPENIDRRLLIAWRRGFQIGQGALEVERIVEVGDESRCDGGIKGHAGQTCVDLAGIEQVGICALMVNINAPSTQMVRAVVLGVLTMSPHACDGLSLGWSAGNAISGCMKAKRSTNGSCKKKRITK